MFAIDARRALTCAAVIAAIASASTPGRADWNDAGKVALAQSVDEAKLDGVKGVERQRLAAATPAATPAPTPNVSPVGDSNQPPAEADVTSAKREAAFKYYLAALDQLGAFEKSGNYRQWWMGLRDAERATFYDSTAADYWRALGYAYSLVAAQDYLAATMAEEALNKAVRLDAKNANAHLLLARLQMDRQSYSRALDNLEAAIKLKPSLATSVIAALMCRAYTLDFQIERGARYFAAFVDANPQSQSARLAEAVLLQELGRTSQALQLVKIVAENPQSAQIDAKQAEALEKAWRGGAK